MKDQRATVVVTPAPRPGLGLIKRWSAPANREVVLGFLGAASRGDGPIRARVTCRNRRFEIDIPPSSSSSCAPVRAWLPQGRETVMPEWSIRVDATGTRQFTEDDADAIVDALSDYGPAAGVAPRGVSIWISLEAASLHGAVDQGLALIDLTLPALDIKHMEARTVEERDRDLDVDDTDYVGAAEVARMLRVSKQRVSALAKTAGFPRPVGRLASGPIWTLASIALFLRKWDRRPRRRWVD